MEKNNQETKKTCFIITPIGNEYDPIRRHIDGIIDVVISPILEDLDFEPIVAHRIDLTGSINKQVITGIYDADLIIANLTQLNPNVMYELAFAHSIGKPTITIAEEGNAKLPFDIATERTIFYKNDFKGVLELKERLESIVGNIEKSKDLEIDNPIYTWLSNYTYENKLSKILETREVENSTKEEDLFKYIISRLDSVESKLNSNLKRNDVINNISYIDYEDTKSDSINISTEGTVLGDVKGLYDKLKKSLLEFSNITVTGMYYSKESESITVIFEFENISNNMAKKIIKRKVNSIIKDNVITLNA